jgi:hypothetical protein
MSTTLTIPANVVPDLREGLLCLMGDATQEINGALIRPERELHPEWFKTGRQRMDHAFALLDLIGWAAGGESRVVRIEVRTYGQPLKEAVDSFLPLLAAQEEEADASDVWRAEHGKAPRKAEIIGRALVLREFATRVEQALSESAR